MKISGSRWGRLDTRQDHLGDGCLQGRDGQLFPSDTPLDQVTPVGESGRAPLVFVNGIMTDRALQDQVHQKFAARGYSVVGVRNATRGLVRDLGQFLADKLNLDANPATRTALRLMQEHLDQGRPLYLMGHSQGSLILSNAVKRLTRQLEQQGLSQEQIGEKLGLLHITTIGGATFRYPPGPRYHHVINWADPVSWTAGNTAFSWLTGGPDRVSHFTEVKRPHGLPELSEGLSTYFCRAVDSSVHGPKDIYADHLPVSGA